MTKGEIPSRQQENQKDFPIGLYEQANYMLQGRPYMAMNFHALLNVLDNNPHMDEFASKLGFTDVRSTLSFPQVKEALNIFDSYTFGPHDLATIYLGTEIVHSSNSKDAVIPINEAILRSKIKLLENLLVTEIDEYVGLADWNKDEEKNWRERYVGISEYARTYFQQRIATKNELFAASTMGKIWLHNAFKHILFTAAHPDWQDIVTRSAQAVTTIDKTETINFERLITSIHANGAVLQSPKFSTVYNTSSNLYGLVAAHNSGLYGNKLLWNHFPEDLKQLLLENDQATVNRLFDPTQPYDISRCVSSIVKVNKRTQQILAAGLYNSEPDNNQRRKLVEALREKGITIPKMMVFDKYVSDLLSS